MGIVATKPSTSNEKTAHTPGPWQLSRDGVTVFASTDGAGVLIRGVEQVIPHVAYVSRNGFSATLAEQQANAHLIAAAPTMLSALQSFMSLQDIDPDRYAGTDSPMLAVVEQVRAAIAKAEGK